MANISLLDTRNSDQKTIDSQLSSFISKYLPGFVPGEPYTGTMTAPMSSYENQGMEFLQKYLTKASGSNANPMLTLAEDELTKTFTDKYDPAKSEYYKTTRDAAAIEQKDAQDKLNQGLGARGKFFSSEALTENRELQTRTSNFLQNTLAAMAEKERTNRLNAVDKAINVDKARTSADLAPVAAATTFGALPREIEQADYEKKYQEFVRQREEKALPLGAAQGAYSNLGMRTVANQDKPKFDWGSFLGQVGGAAVGGYFGGPAGASVGASVGGSIF